MGTDAPGPGGRLHTHTGLSCWVHELADAAPERALAERAVQDEQAGPPRAAPTSRRRSARSLETALPGEHPRLRVADASSACGWAVSPGAGL